MGLKISQMYIPPIGHKIGQNANMYVLNKFRYLKYRVIHIKAT